MGDRTRRYVATLTVLAAVAGGFLAVAAGTPLVVPLQLVAVAAAIAIAERTEVVFTWGRTTAGFTLIEVAITASLLLVSPTHVLLAAVPAIAVAHAPRLRTPVKVVYNVASVALGIAVAGLLLVATPAVGPLVDGRPVLGIILGMAGYAIVSTVAFAGLLRRLSTAPGSAERTLRSQLRLTGAATLGTTSIGIVLAALLLAQPELAPFVLAPAAAVHLATRASVRAAALLEATRVDHDRLVRVVDGASDGIVLLDGDGTVEVWNPAMTAISGIPAEDAVGRNAAEVLGPAVREPADRVRDAWVGPDVHHLLPQTETAARLATPDGTVRDVRERHARTYDDRGRCTGEVVVVRDVSREQELARLRSDFVARVSHELRTPLTPIRGFATVLLRRGDLLSREEREEALSRIVERTDHLQALVEDLLLVTRLEHAQVEGLDTDGTRRGATAGTVGAGGAAGPVTEDLVVPQRTRIGEVAGSAVSALRVHHPRRTVTLALDAAERSDGRPGDLALADPYRTHQIVAALLDNAVRYTPEDSPIEVEVDREEDDVVVRVRDHGGGIPVTQRDRIFERFHRLEDPLTMRTGGVGLGLFIGRQLAEAMHGSLRLRPSPPGTGATFELRLPVARPSVGGAVAGSPPVADRGGLR